MSVIGNDTILDALLLRLHTEADRPATAPWWNLKLATERIPGPQPVRQPVGQLQPILVDPLGDPVVGVWLSPDDRIRWYIVPDDINWNVVLDWLIHQAIPTYVPTAAQRHRASSFVDTGLLTPAESHARQALAVMESRHAEERARLEAEFTKAQAAAEPLRDGLFYGTGNELVRAVETVLRAAGFNVVDLDTELGRTASADLLVTFEGHRRLIEVKSEGRNAREALVADLLRHLRIWPDLRAELPVGGGVLVVNHQHRLLPADRDREVYRRMEFVRSLTTPVLAVHELFDWWRTADWAAIRRAILGTDPPDQNTAPRPPKAPVRP